MAKVYVIRNQHGHYAGRKGEWLCGRDAGALAVFAHHDQAVNHLFELGIKDIHLRGKLCQVNVQENGKPAITEIGPDVVSEAEALSG